VLLGSFRTEQMADASRVAPQLVYVTDRRGTQEVWITSLAEGWDRPLFTPGNFQVDGAPAQLFLTPAFSPDGRRVAVAAKGNGQIHVYTAFASGGAPVRATTGQTDLEDAPAWSPDGNWLAFMHVAGNSLRLAKVRPASGEPPVDLGSVDSNPVPAWSPTGGWIAASNSENALTLFSPDGKPSRQLPGGDSGPVAWSRDGKTLYHLHLDPPELRAIDIATGRERKLRDLTGMAPFASINPGLCAALTSDGKSIVYTVNRPRQEIWILDGLQEPRAWYRRLWGR
jgi:TolB protein